MALTPHAFLPPLIIAFLLLAAFALLLAADLLVPPPLTTPLPVSPSATASPRPRSIDSTLLQTTKTLRPPGGTLALVRLIYPPGSSSQRPVAIETLLIIVESGALRVRLNGPAQYLQSDQAPSTVDDPVDVRGGQGLLLPAKTVATLQNASPTLAIATAVGIVQADRTSAPVGIPTRGVQPVMTRWAAAIDDGVTLVPLASSWMDGHPSHSVTLKIQRLELSPQTTTVIGSAGDSLLAIEAGTMRLTVTKGLGWQHRADGGWGRLPLVVRKGPASSGMCGTLRAFLAEHPSPESRSTFPVSETTPTATHRRWNRDACSNCPT